MGKYLYSLLTLPSCQQHLGHSELPNRYEQNSHGLRKQSTTIGNRTLSTPDNKLSIIRSRPKYPHIKNLKNNKFTLNNSINNVIKTS